MWEFIPYLLFGVINIIFVYYIMAIVAAPVDSGQMTCTLHLVYIPNAACRIWSLFENNSNIDFFSAKKLMINYRR